MTRLHTSALPALPRVWPCNFPSVTCALSRSKGTDCLLWLLRVRVVDPLRKGENEHLARAFTSSSAYKSVSGVISGKVVEKSRVAIRLKPWKNFQKCPPPTLYFFFLENSLWSAANYLGLIRETGVGRPSWESGITLGMQLLHSR